MPLSYHLENSETPQRPENPRNTESLETTLSTSITKRQKPDSKQSQRVTRFEKRSHGRNGIQIGHLELKILQKQKTNKNSTGETSLAGVPLGLAETSPAHTTQTAQRAAWPLAALGLLHLAQPASFRLEAY